MIVAPVGGQLLVITQNDHAHFAGELLALWRSDGIPEHPRRRELLFAAREHDNGWAEADSAPLCRHGSARPVDFMTVPRETRWQIWRRGTSRYIEREPYSTLLIVRHAVHLHRAHLREPVWSEVFGQWSEIEAELMETTGATEAMVEGDYRWIELTDILSLTACRRWTRKLESHGFRSVLRTAGDANALAGNTLIVDPFPLAGATTFRVACRLIPDRPYAGDADLGTELATARWRHYSVRVAPGI